VLRAARVARSGRSERTERGERADRADRVGRGQVDRTARFQGDRAGRTATDRAARATVDRPGRSPMRLRTGLDTPLEIRRGLPTPQVDVEAFGRWSERFARFMGTAWFLVGMTVFVAVWLCWNTFAPERLQFDPRALNYTLLTLILSLQASYAAPLILLAQNRQADRDRVSFEQDRQRAERALADTEYLAREVAALRIALREVATRDYLRSELRDLLDELTAEIAAQGPARGPDRDPGPAGGAGEDPAPDGQSPPPPGGQAQPPAGTGAGRPDHPNRSTREGAVPKHRS
jgi:uncharacterized membrane protein